MAMPHLRFLIKLGDIVRVEDVHHFDPRFYQVYSIERDGVRSQPADFFHPFSCITAIYRRDGDDLRCIWILR